MRFDPESLAQGVTSRLAVLLFAELVDAGKPYGSGAARRPWSATSSSRSASCLNGSCARWRARFAVGVAERIEVNFETADAAVNAALDLHEALARAGLAGARPRPPDRHPRGTDRPVR